MTTTRRILAAAVAFVYTALAAWAVHAVGKGHRDALATARAAAEPRDAADAPTPAETPEVPPRPVVAVAEAVKPPPPIAVPAPTPVPTPAPAPPPAVALAPAVKEVRPVSPAPAPRPFRSLPLASDWANKLDLERPSAADEARLGAELNGLIRAMVPPFEKGDYLRRVKAAARPMLEARARKDVEYTFTVLDSEEVNAFSVPGGYVYVNRALFDLIGSDHEEALAFVLGHEIAHVDRRHALLAVAPVIKEARKRGADTLQELLVPVIFAYPDAREFEADDWAFRRLTTFQGVSRYKALWFLRKLQGHATANDFLDGHKAPNLESDVPVIDNHIRAQAAVYDRLERLSAVDLTGGGGSAKPSQAPRTR